ncbi:SMP-30/gluconolactonase/LRE family protein [Nocardioides panzhihuensis]|uniref:Cu-Zn family superoxide dismutase n=1 Tax=Nocardioides panzhihuensis TaxID=860243 RepID=A0A7Z0IV07_9ACTN|nr:SBBP repeat-containing protein [Nocardioides panzhihuensis]NYI80764.1 Cu-Zn family superoxide dismutase [Nocardioides panzhihuensis]
MRTSRIAALAGLAGIAATATMSFTALGKGTAASAAEGNGRPASYLLEGDPSAQGGSKFEGIGVDKETGAFYVSEVTGGEIQRGTADRTQAEEWLGGDGTDGRYTARGITVDDEGRIYIAGGPNGTGNDRPDLWVYSPEGELLAALRVPDNTAFLNDVAIGPDGAAYFTNSNDPTIIRVAEGAKTTGARSSGELARPLVPSEGVTARSADGWQATEWADGSSLITPREGFNLGGIVLSQDRSAFVVAQGTTGQLWRFSIATGEVSEIDTDGADLRNADGLVRQGRDLAVIRNFDKQLVHLELNPSATSAENVSSRATDPDRVLTTGKLLGGRMLMVDSHFDEQTAQGPYEIVTARMPR